MNLRYRAVYEKGKPVHKKTDDFYIKHPPMDLSKRAKIFSPFDALRGFGDALASKEKPGGILPEDHTDEETPD
ncbi:MAG: hypothetical protein J6Z46_07285 [Lachnospiraceae bacterium]|nr:hypothetical protein [Lachnospiraceae bacterium]